MTNIKIRKKIFILISFLISITTGLSGQSIDDRLADITCQCMDSLNIRQVFDLPMDCLKNKTLNDEEIISQLDSLTRIEGDSYQVGYDWGSEKWPRIMSSMILTCDHFYHAVENLRNSGFKNKDTVEIMRDFQKADSLIESGKSPIGGYYTKATNYMFMNKLDSALHNVNRALDLYDEFAQGYLLRGHIYEKMGQYHLAKRDYETCLNLPTGPEQTIFYIKIVERKIRDSE